ncbi:MAG: hypothetical protein OXO50_09245 [Caldilineaceae bacterium]|nr:hypothetical protein [Caldilineaceae bacterium]
MIRTQVAAAVRLVQRQIRWKPGSAERHLWKRKRRGHLPLDATLAEYEQIIRSAVMNQAAIVYLYAHDDLSYVAVAAGIQERTWLIMFDLDGVLETAYIVERPDLYLRKSVFDRVGALAEVLS